MLLHRPASSLDMYTLSGLRVSGVLRSPLLIFHRWCLRVGETGSGQSFPASGVFLAFSALQLTGYWQIISTDTERRSPGTDT